LRDQGSIVPTIYLCVSRTEALLMASNTSYHKSLHGLHRFTYHILVLFAACRCLAALISDDEDDDGADSDDGSSSDNFPRIDSMKPSKLQVAL
jgi:hypothetical protein